jgi:hypothetical protein
VKEAFDVIAQLIVAAAESPALFVSTDFSNPKQRSEPEKGCC